MVTKEQAIASQKKQQEANDAAKARQDAQISAGSGARAGPGQSNRGYQYESRDQFGNVEGANKGVPYSSGPSAVPSGQSNSPVGRAISISLSENLSLSDRPPNQTPGYYPGISSYEGIPKNMPQRKTGKSYSVSLNESLNISSGPPTGVGSTSTNKQNTATIKPVSLETTSYITPKIKLIPPVFPKLIKPIRPQKGRWNIIPPEPRQSKQIKQQPFGIMDQSPKPSLKKPSNVQEYPILYRTNAAFTQGSKAIAQNPIVQNILKASNISLKGEAAKISKGKNQIQVSLSNATIIPGSIEYATSQNKKPLVLSPYERQLDPLNNRADLIQTVQRPVLNLGKYIVAGVEGTKRIIQTGDPLAGEKYYQKEVAPTMKETASSRLFSNPSELFDPKKLPENLISATTEISMYAFMGGRLGKQKDTSIFKNFKSETIKPGKGGGSPTGPSGGNVGGEYMTIKVKSPFSKSIRESIRDVGNKFVKSSAKSKSVEPSKFPVLTKPSDIAPIYKIIKPDYKQWAVKGITKPNKFQGFDQIKIAKNMNTGEKIALAGRTKNKFLKVKEIKELKINQPEEFVKGKDGNIDIQTFTKGHLKFDRTQKSGFEEIKMTDQRTGISKTRTSINMNMGKPSIGWIAPRGKPKSSMNDIFATPKDAQVKDFKKFLQVEKIKTNEEIFSGGKGKNNQPGLMQKQASELKQETALKVDLLNPQKQSFKVKSVALGLGKVYYPKQKQGQNFFVPQMPKPKQGQAFFIPQMPKQKEGQSFFIPELSKQPTKQKQPQGFFIPEPTKQKQPTKQDQPQVFFTPEPTKQTQPWPFPTPSPQRTTPVEPIPRGGFAPYFPSAFFGSGGYENPASLKKAFAAYGISSDINIKTLPTYSRYSSGTGIFKEQAKEDVRIQNLFYGKPRKKSSAKKKSGSKRKGKKR